MDEPEAEDRETTQPYTIHTVNMFELEQYSDWRCQLFGSKNYIYVPTKGNEPNRFWRWMQYICFGNKWVRIHQDRR